MSDDFFDDDYDPLAPLPDRPRDDDPGSPDTPATPGDGGFSDSEGLVRIWVDDAGRLTKVRVSPVWFRRIRPGQTLEAAFRMAFLRAGLRVAPTRWQPPTGEPAAGKRQPTTEPTPVTIEAISEQVEAAAAHRRAWFAKLEEVRSMPAPPAPTFRGSVEGATVTLTNDGRPKRVEFDDGWLDRTQVGAVCTAVLAAADAAHAQVEAHEPDDGPAEELRTMAEQQTAMLHTLCHLLDPGPPPADRRP